MTEAALFDRDGTLCHNDEREERFRDECISRWAGHAFELPYDKFISAFNAVGARKLGFIAFRIDRAGGSGDEWTIDSLWRMAEYHARGQRRGL